MHDVPQVPLNLFQVRSAKELVIFFLVECQGPAEARITLIAVAGGTNGPSVVLVQVRAVLGVSDGLCGPED